ncbi:aminoacyl-tRNA hydrolase [Flavobacterium amniphilum]|uniref:alternative ribosome rescue aminoacyl-tRNA hydrolase ArfB n=1 Tax=Flavobacterium amniphilum TaxID=1834035 RepID=UPI00202AC007|nr:alternative ribosome rescue aminoacyl-tRNA hydrolase ArfB [Flavobacterium amniphilum]MCL9806045.1 aminoacyl-tRNA hydrolase [Flavobacterium amniphilum]
MVEEIILSELEYKAVRSSGAGGQNVNKVSSKVVLSFNLNISKGLTEEEKEWLIAKLGKKLSQENILLLTCEEDRSQRKNKETVTKKLFDLLQKALVKPKARKETKVPKGVKEKRLNEKKNNSEIKNSRRKPDF